MLASKWMIRNPHKTLTEFKLSQTSEKWLEEACNFLQQKREEYEQWMANEDQHGHNPEVGLKRLPVLVDCELLYPSERIFVPKIIHVERTNIFRSSTYNMRQDFEGYGPLETAVELLESNPIVFAELYLMSEKLEIEYLADFLFYLMMEYRHSDVDCHGRQTQYYTAFKYHPLLLEGFRAALNSRKNRKSEAYKTHPRLIPRVTRCLIGETLEDDFQTDLELKLTTGHEFVEANHYFMKF